MSRMVLVVDDSAMIRMQVSRALSGAGIEVVVAKDGQDAWEQLEEGLRPAMMICDVNMPRMSGLELIELMHQSGEYTSVPVIMLTTESQPALIRRARELGVVGWLVKPFRPDLLISAVNKITGMAA